MKNTRNLCIVILCILFSFIGCNKNPGKLSLNLKKGDLYKVETNKIEKVNENVKGEKIELDSKIKTSYLCNVINIDNNKNSEIKVTIDSINIKYNTNNGQTSINNMYLTKNSEKLSKVYPAFVGKSFKVKIGEYGKVKEIIGMEDLMNKALKELNIKDNKEKKDIKSIMNKEFSEENITKRIERITAVYYNERVKVGDEWGHKTSASDRFPVEAENKYKLKEREDGTSEVEVKSNIKTKENVEPVTIDKMKIIYEDMKGNQKGVIIVNEDTGLIKSVEMERDYSGHTKLLYEDPNMGTELLPISVYEKNVINVLRQ